MPKRTAILLLLYTGIILVSGVAASRWAKYAPYIGYETASEAKGISETALLSTVVIWSAISSARKWLRCASVIGSALFILAEHAYFQLLLPAMTRWEVVLLGFLPGILGTICGAYLIAGWFMYKRFSLRPFDRSSNQSAIYRIRFSIGELFVFTFVCAAIIGFACVASLELADDWESRVRFMFAIALLGLPSGVSAGMAAWSVLLSKAPWLSILLCLALIAVSTWAIAYFLFGESGTANLASFLQFPVPLFAAQICFFWSLRSAGYRLVWRENALVADNPAVAS